MAASRISSSSSKVRPGGSVTQSTPAGIPPVLRRFWEFTKKMATTFSRHLGKDRSQELEQAVIEGFRHV